MERAPRWPPRLRDACRALDCAQATRHVDRLIGWGEGLTPAGDDFLVGLIAGLDALVARRRSAPPVPRRAGRDAHALAPGARRRSRRTTFALPRRPTTRSRCSRLRSALLCEDDGDVVDAALQSALAVGASSGADTVSGLLAGLLAWLPAPATRCACTIMTTIRFKVFANLYKDSVTLMQLGAQLRERDGIAQASCLMATPANLAQLLDADLSIDTQASPSDLLVVVRGDPACVRRGHRGGRGDAAGEGGRRRRRRDRVLAAADEPRTGRRIATPTPTSR